ncbi:MAG: hypothetical protein JST26_05495 [Bacteroidetes bacterium]|nr:hypothetical protein [Bacteroidota bacterium]
MKTNNIIIAVLIILCLILCLAFILSVQNTKESNTPPAVDLTLLKKENDSLKKVNLSLDYQLLQFSLEMDSLRGKLDLTTQTIKQIKIKQHENLNHLDSLNSHELYGFFSKFNP